jgi:DNA invertase Pin-like site-specific DNA recombinase
MAINVTDEEKDQIWNDVYQFLKECTGKLENEMSRSEIMDATGLSRNKVIRKMNKLIAQGKCSKRNSTNSKGPLVYYTILDNNHSS